MHDVTTCWEVHSLDVWGNREDGWDINNQCKVGSVQLTNVDVATDGDLLDQLVDAGYLRWTGLPEGIEVDGDCDYLYINDAVDGKPLMHLVRADD